MTLNESLYVLNNTTYLSLEYRDFLSSCSDLLLTQQDQKQENTKQQY